MTEDDEGLAGVAAALRRGPVWGLSMLAVRVGVQARGTGGALLRHALRTAGGAACGLIVSSTDARAMRLCARGLRPAAHADRVGHSARHQAGRRAARGEQDAKGARGR